MDHLVRDALGEVAGFAAGGGAKHIGADLGEPLGEYGAIWRSHLDSVGGGEVTAYVSYASGKQ